MKAAWVDEIPAELETDYLYISVPYRTTCHLCACGCGERVVLRLSPRHWQVMFNGSTVSVYPSIGRWQSNCRSHYWIIEGRVAWGAQWSEERVRRNRRLTRGQLTGLPQWWRHDIDEIPRTSEFFDSSADVQPVASQTFRARITLWFRRLMRRSKH